MVAERGVWQIPEKICEQIVDVHVPQVVGQVLEVPKIPSLDRILQCTVEQILEDRIRVRNPAADCGGYC